MPPTHRDIATTTRTDVAERQTEFLVHTKNYNVKRELCIIYIIIKRLEYNPVIISYVNCRRNRRPFSFWNSTPKI